jgi:hypothetical protein
MKPEVRIELKQLLIKCIQEKIKKYNPETESKPFFEAIFSKRAVNLASLIQSFYTSFGTSIYEQMAVLLAEKNAHYQAKRQHLLLGKIDPKTETLINDMHLEILRTGLSGVKSQQIEIIKKSVLPATPEKDPESVVDIFVKTPSGHEYYFDIIALSQT